MFSCTNILKMFSDSLDTAATQAVLALENSGVKREIFSGPAAQHVWGKLRTARKFTMPFIIFWAIMALATKTAPYSLLLPRSLTSSPETQIIHRSFFFRFDLGV